MPAVNTADLVGPALDYVMATLEELPIRHDPMAFGNTANGGYWVWPDAKGQGIPCMKIGPNLNPNSRDVTYSPSTNWSQLGPLILKFPIVMGNHESGSDDGTFTGSAHCNTAGTSMETPLGIMVATCRAMIAFRIGQTVNVPASLLALLPKP